MQVWFKSMINSGNITYNRETTAIPIKNGLCLGTPVSDSNNSTSVALKPILGEIQTGTILFV
jgi:hypothetical protein